MTLAKLALSSCAAMALAMPAPDSEAGGRGAGGGRGGGSHGHGSHGAHHGGHGGAPGVPGAIAGGAPAAPHYYHKHQGMHVTGGGWWAGFYTPTYYQPDPYWYFCPMYGAFYPYVQDCPSGWQPVRPPPPQG